MLQTIKNDIKEAMREKNNELKSILRMVMAKANDTAKADGNRETTDADVMSAIQKQIKQNKDVITLAKENDRDSDKDEREVEILMNYLPQQMSEEDIQTLVEGIVSELPEDKRNNKGRGIVMAKLRPYKDQLDMGKASQIAGKLLS